ncbi:sideroflexin 1, partial [Mytilus galloprovincialis]
LGLSYVGASAGAIGTAMTIKSLVKRFPPIVARFVPFIAVASANCINIPMMRSRELLEGIPVYDADGNRVGESKKAAEKAIALVLFSRICMAAPGMLTPPFIMHALESKAFMKPWLNAPVQIGLVGFFVFTIKI